MISLKDEIKEINITFPGQILDYVDTKEHLLDLFNYITNLQKENERLNNIIDELEKWLEENDKQLCLRKLRELEEGK